MYTGIKSAFVLFFSGFSVVVLAAVEPSYITFYYNVHAVSSKISDKQCEALYQIPRQYTIKNDQVIYKDNPNYVVSNYQR